MRRIRFGIVVAAVLVSCCLTRRAHALGEETIGNAPLNERNYTEWPGLGPVVNDKARVYQRWVNGNEHCLYRGDTADLNVFLRNFAKIGAGRHEAVLRPGARDGPHV